MIAGGIHRGARRGVTLIELIAAIVILSIGLPPMLMAVRDAHVQRVNPHLTSRARWLAEERLEEIIADRHSSTRGWAYLSGVNYPAEGAITGSPGFTRSVSFTETEADLVTPGSGYMVAEVTVGWTDGAGEARELAVTTVLAE